MELLEITKTASDVWENSTSNGRKYYSVMLVTRAGAVDVHDLKQMPHEEILTVLFDQNQLLLEKFRKISKLL